MPFDRPLALTQGDPAGIGPDITLAAWTARRKHGIAPFLFLGDPAVLAHFVAMTRVHAALAPYVATLCDTAAQTGLPLQRPLLLDWEDDRDCWGIETQYGYGPDLIVAPVIEPGVDRWSAYLPAGATWVHLWSGERFTGGSAIEVAAPIGQPPVFWREGSDHAALFAGLVDAASR